MNKKGLFAMMALASLMLIGLSATAERTTATFTATSTNPSNTFASATVTMSNNKPNANDLVNVSSLIPGDTAQRTVTVTNSGTVGFTYTGSISAVANTLLWSDTTNGLQVDVYRCACTLVANRVYTGALKNMSIPASGTIAATGTETLTYVFSFPTAAGNTFQNLSQDFTVTYTATQLAGSAR